MTWFDTRDLEARISRLDEVQFADLCNRLIMRALDGVGIDRSLLSANLKTKEPDGGLDARIDSSPEVVARIIPSATVGYQFKAGTNAKSAKALVAEDVVPKPRVVDLLQNGGSFVFMAAWDRGDGYEEAIYDEIAAAGITVNRTGIVFMGGASLAYQISQRVGLVAAFLHVDVPMSLECWSSLPYLTNPFVQDDGVRARIDALRLEIEKDSARVRIVGTPGDGKTRTVLEALRASRLADTVVYARQPDEVPKSFISHLASSPNIECTLVVDELDDADWSRLQDSFARMRSPSVRLVTIGPAHQTTAEPTLRIPAMSEDLLVKAMASVALGLDEQALRDLASRCKGSPKFALLIAREIRDGHAQPTTLLATQSIRGALDQLLSVEETSLEWKAISTLSMLEEVGWKDELEDESSVLFDFMDLDPRDARRAIMTLDERFGIAPQARRFRYVSPGILADHLAARQLASWQKSDIENFIGCLTPRMSESFCSRVRRLAGALENKKTVEEVVFGDHGPFRDLVGLGSPGLVLLLRRLAGAYPHATLRCLGRMLGPASRAELRAATEVRRDLVWTLDQLLWKEDTFPQAATLLLKLASAENETWANNATGTWAECFQMVQGRTDAPFSVRIDLLRRLAGAGDPEERRLVALALDKAVTIEHIFRMGMPPTDIAGMPDDAWRPETYQEWGEAIAECLELLTSLLTDEEERVRHAAVEALRTAVVAARKWQPLTSSWLKAASLLLSAPWSHREPIATALAAECQRVNVHDASDVGHCTRLQEFCEELVGDDMSSRLRWNFVRPVWVVDEAERAELERDRATQLRELAQAAVSNPHWFRTELAWLESQATAVPESWIGTVAERDKDHVLEPDLRVFAETSRRGLSWLSQYLLVTNQASSDEALDALIEQEEGNPSLVCDLILRSSYAPERAKRLISLVASNQVPSTVVGGLSYSPWASQVDHRIGLDLVRVAWEDGAKMEAATLMRAVLRQQPEAKPVFSEFAHQLLETPGHLADAHWINQHEWFELALTYAEDFPETILASVLDFPGVGFERNRQVEELVARAWTACSDKRSALDAVLQSPTAKRVWRLESLRSIDLGLVDRDELIAWIDQSPEDRPQALARIAGPPTLLSYDIQGMLLSRYPSAELGSTFCSMLVSGAYSGSLGGWLRSKIRDLEVLGEQATEQPVREWAKQTVKRLEDDARAADERAAEEELFDR